LPLPSPLQTEPAPSTTRKRASPGSFFPPSQLIAIWAPLLKFIQLQHTDFALLLTTRICSQLVVSELSSLDLIALSESKLDPTYLACLSRWANWTISSLPDSDSKDELRKDAVMQLLQELGKAMVSPKQHKARYVGVVANYCILVRQSCLISDAVLFISQRSGAHTGTL
jgi:hypothetical protein